MDMKRIPTAHLLESLSADAAILPSVAQAIETWMENRGWHPGGTKTPSQELYRDFAEWYTQVYDFAGAVPTSTAWGREARKYLKRGRGAAGRFYYTSRLSNAELVEKIGG